MSRILTSLHGNKLGLDDQGRLIAPKGVVAGENGNQFASPSPSTVVWTDDFVGDVLADQWNYLEGTDTSPTDGAVITAGIGGVLRLTTGDSAGTLAADMAQVTGGLLQWQASNGNLVAQTRVKFNTAVATRYFFFGFTDVVTLEAAIISAGSGDNITTTASDAVGFMYDTRMTTDNIWLVGVAANVDATEQDSLVTPVADTWTVLRVEINASGVAVFFINGLQVGTAMSGAVTPAADLTPTINFGTLSAASVTLDVDYMHISMAR